MTAGRLLECLIELVKSGVELDEYPLVINIDYEYTDKVDVELITEQNVSCLLFTEQKN